MSINPRRVFNVFFLDVLALVEVRISLCIALTASDAKSCEIRDIALSIAHENAVEEKSWQAKKVTNLANFSKFASKSSVSENSLSLSRYWFMSLLFAR
jgi:hypothetical protein